MIFALDIVGVEPEEIVFGKLQSDCQQDVKAIKHFRMQRLSQDVSINSKLSIMQD